ncbi:MAG: nicotinate phosphoribosyltransferase [Methanomassiliicoccales archaeon]
MADEEEVLEGKTTDIYFARTLEILRARGMTEHRAVAEYTTGSLPEDWPWAIFCGLEETLTLLEGKDVNLWGLPEGTLFRPRDMRGYRLPVMTIEGPYFEYCVFETPTLGFICHSSGVATMAARCRKAAQDRSVIAFGIRRMNPFLTPSLDRASFIGGCDGVSSILGAETIGEEPRGTMPHALMIMHGDEAEAFRAFDEVIDPEVPRVALVDTYSDEKFASLIACENVEDLYGVRLDTPGSRKGSFPELIREVRWEMDVRGYGHVKILVSGGLDEHDIFDLQGVPVDGFGVGTSITNAPTVDFAMDIVEREGRPVAKRGKLGGRKEVYRCPRCMECMVVPHGSEIPECPHCKGGTQPLYRKLLDRGERVEEPLPPRELREKVLDQLSQVNLEMD